MEEIINSLSPIERKIVPYLKKGIKEIIIKSGLDRTTVLRALKFFFAIKSSCKYNNCIHHKEPNCGVKKAVEQQKIAASRYNSYLNMLELEDENYRINKFE